MGSVARFEELIAWQKARALVREIYELTKRPDFSRDYALVNQIRRAAISIMSNIAEGFERKGRGEFHQFLLISKASCAEVRSQLYIAHDVGYLDEESFRRVLHMAEEVARIIGGLRASVERMKNEDRRRTA
jgi:four helix bundle protein